MGEYRPISQVRFCVPEREVANAVRHVNEIRVEAALVGGFRCQLDEALNTRHVQKSINLATLAKDRLVLCIEEVATPHRVFQEVENVIESPLLVLESREDVTVPFVQAERWIHQNVEISARVFEVVAVHSH
jgi:hypothetical protein